MKKRRSEAAKARWARQRSRFLELDLGDLAGSAGFHAPMIPELDRKIVPRALYVRDGAVIQSKQALTTRALSAEWLAIRPLNDPEFWGGVH